MNEPSSPGVIPNEIRNYTSLVKGERRSYNPATDGFFAYACKESSDDTLANGERLVLAYGSLSKPSLDRSQVERDMALKLADYPELADRLALFVVPGVLTSRDGWAFVTDRVPRQTLELAKMVGLDLADRDQWLDGDSEYLAGLCQEFDEAPTLRRLPTPEPVVAITREQG